MRIILSVLALVAAFAHADDPSLPTIIYFGGYRATQAQMVTWENGYRRSRVGASYNFVGVPYPSKSANTVDVLRDGAKVVQLYANFIKAHPRQDFILAGHSSGGVLPTAVAQLLPKTAKVKLYIFDGANRAAALQNVFPTVCYSARNPMAGCLKRITFKAPTCQASGKWCPHFRMINANAAPGLISIDHGYDNFIPFLDWPEE